MKQFIQIKYLVTIITVALFVFTSNGLCQNLYVYNAGLSYVNGLYQLNGTMNGKNKYTQSILILQPQHQIYFNGLNLWYLSKATNPSEVLYQAFSGTDIPIPPETGWTAVKEGISPGPVIGSEPLPVELVSFTAIIQDNSVLLSWRTETEVDNFGFEIQKAVNPASNIKSWELAGFVEGAGNSNSPKDYSFNDTDIEGADVIHYRLKQIDNDGSYSYSPEVEVDFISPDEYALNQNYPNPFNPSTKINYKIARNEHVNLSVYNVLGKEIAVLVNELQSPGSYAITFSADDLPGGVYFYKLETPGFTKTSKMILLK